MTGKRDDTADAIRAFLNRYRAEVLGEPVAFEEAGRPNRYTFVDDVTGTRANVWRSDDATVTIDGDEVDVDIEDLSVSVEFEPADEPHEPPSLEEMVEDLRKTRERRSFRRLFDRAATTLSVGEPVAIDDFRDLVERLRREGYGSTPSYDPTDWVDVSYDASGTVFVVGAAVDDDLREATDEFVDFGDGPVSVDGVPVLKSPDVPSTKGVLVDVDALSRKPFGPPDPKDPKFSVADPKGVAAIERVEGGR